MKLSVQARKEARLKLKEERNTEKLRKKEEIENLKKKKER